MPDFANVLMASRYRLEDQIAMGGFGDVWRGVDVVLDRPVAIKLLRSAYAADPMTLARFRAEARHAASLSHANIAAVYDFCEPPGPGTPFLVMEHVAGPSLAGLLADGPMSPVPAMDVIAGAAAGLGAAHRAGLVHRDIKPSNLLLGQDGQVKITDFGISHAAGSAPLTVTGVLMGTPAYMAPERVGGAGGRPASDIYSLGIVAYHAVSGAIPFAGNPVEVAMAHRERPLPPLPAFVPPEVAAFIMWLTAKDPAARPADASDVARWAGELRDWLMAEPVAAGNRGRAVAEPARFAGPTRIERPVRDRARAASTPGRLYRRAGIAAAAVAMTVLGWHLASAHSPAHGYAADALPRITGSDRSYPPHVAAAQLVDVKASSLIGQPLPVAERRLRGLGLSVMVVWQPTDGAPPGTVVSVRPAGQVAAGSRVELVAAYRPAPSWARTAAPSKTAASSGGKTHGRGHGPKAPEPKPSTGDSQGSSSSSSPSPTGGSGDGSGGGNGGGGGDGNGGGGDQAPPAAYSVGG